MFSCWTIYGDCESQTKKINFNLKSLCSIDWEKYRKSLQYGTLIRKFDLTCANLTEILLGRTRWRKSVHRKWIDQELSALSSHHQNCCYSSHSPAWRDIDVATNFCTIYRIFVAECVATTSPLSFTFIV